MTLNFDLSSQLVLHFRINDLFFVQNFECHNKFWSFFSRKIHMSELASTHRFSDLKVIDGPFFWIEFPGDLRLLLSALQLDIIFLKIDLGTLLNLWHRHHVRIWSLNMHIRRFYNIAAHFMVNLTLLFHIRNWHWWIRFASFPNFIQNCCSLDGGIWVYRGLWIFIDSWTLGPV